jgi:hypothetical protein
MMGEKPREERVATASGGIAAECMQYTIFSPFIFLRALRDAMRLCRFHAPSVIPYTPKGAMVYKTFVWMIFSPNGAMIYKTFVWMIFSPNSEMIYNRKRLIFMPRVRHKRKTPSNGTELSLPYARSTLPERRQREQTHTVV